MLNQKLVDYSNYSSIEKLLTEIDIALAKNAKIMYNNLIFALNYPCNKNEIIALLHYKRILTYKLYNENYTSFWPVNQIMNKVKLLTSSNNFR